jgi:Tfp pilus assembly protein PilF
MNAFRLACLVLALAVAGCAGKEERVKFHLDKARALYEQGEYDKAGVEVKNVLQIDPRSSEAYFLAAQIWEKQADPQKAFAGYFKSFELAPGNLEAKGKLGRYYLLGGDAAKAEQIAAELLEADPSSPAAHTVRAALAARGGNIDAAMEEARRVLAGKPGDADASMLLATLLMSKQDVAGARKVLEQAVERHPQDVEFRLALAAVLERLNDNEAAAEQYARVVAQAPKHMDYRVAQASHLVRWGKIDRAEAVLREAIKADPNDEQRYLVLATFLAQQRSFEVADRALADLIAERKKAYQIRFGRVNLLLGARRTDEAIKALEEIIALDKTGPSGLQARSALARIHLAENRPQQADELIAQVLKANPRDNAALLLRAQRYLARNDPRDAIVDLRAVLKDQPDSPELVALLARAHLANQEPDLARETVSRAAQLYPNNADLRVLYAGFLVSQNEHEAAVRELDDLLRAHPSNAKVLQAKADIQASRKDWKGAEATLKTLIAAAPRSALGHYRLAQLYLAQGRPDATLKELDRARENAPQDFEILAATVRLLIMQKKPEEGLQRIRQAIAAQPDNAALQVMLGETLAALKRYEPAAAAFTKAIELDKKLAAGYTNLAQLYLASDKPAAAEQVLRAGLEAEPKNLPVSLLLADLLQRQGRFDEAMARYEDIMRYAPWNDVAANNLAMLLADRRAEKASLARAVELSRRFENSRNPLQLDTLGWAYYQVGDYGKAVSVLERAVKGPQDIPVIEYHLGLALYRAGKIESGKAYLRKSVESATTSFPGVEEAKRILAQG